jgi:hypothetical protein
MKDAASDPREISYPKIGDHSIRTGPEALVMSSFIVLPFKS